MESVFYYVIEFLLAFLLVQLYYKIIYNPEKSKNKDKRPAEVSLFIKFFNIDLRKADYVKLSNKLYLTNSVVVALVLLSTELSSNILLKILIAVLTIIAYTYVAYKLLGYSYKKKGMTKNV